MRSRRHIVAILFLFLLTVGVLLVSRGLPVLERAARGLMVAQLSQRLGARVSVGSLQVFLLPPRIAVERLEIRKEKGPLRYLGIGSAVIEPGVGPIFVGRISIRRVEVDDPAIRLDLTDETPAKPTRRFRRIRVPTLADLIRVRVEEIRVRGASLSLKLPGEDLRVQVGAGSATYRGGRASERWSWNGSGKMFRGKRSLALDGVKIVADRVGERISLDQFEANGLGASVSLKGAAYPEADLFLQVRGRLDPIEGSLRKLGVLSRSFGLKGAVGAEGRVKGAWDSLAFSGEFRGTDLGMRGRTIARTAFSFRVNRRTIEAASGEVDLGGGTVRFSVGSLQAGRPGTFELTAEKIPFSEIQRLIRPASEPKLVGPVDVAARGKVGFRPWLLSGSYSVTSPELSLRISEILDPYLPLRFRDLEVRGEGGWSEERNFFLEKGTLKLEGASGTYGFDFPRGRAVRGVWDATVERAGRLFADAGGIEGVGRITGGIETRTGGVQALLKIRLDTFRYKSHPTASFDGDLVFEKGRTILRGFRFRAGKGSLRLDGKIPNENSEPLTLSGSFTDFDLGWISSVAARRFPFCEGVEGVGSGSVTLSGEAGNPTGTIRFSSKRVSWRGETFDRLDALLDLERGDLIVQKGEVEGAGLSARLRGVAGHGRFRGLEVDAKRIPLSLVSVPPFLHPLARQADLRVRLEGESANPRIDGEVVLTRKDENQRSEVVGRGKMAGEASDLAWDLDLQGGTFRANGRLNARDGTAFKGSGSLRRFSLAPLVPGSGLFVTADWDLASNPKQPSSWNGSALVSGFEIERGDWKASLSEPVKLALNDGHLRLDPALFVGAGTEFRLKGNAGLQGELSLEGKGRVPLKVLTLFPLGLTRADGEAEVEASLGGAFSAPLLNGRLKVRDGLLQFRSVPHPFESLSAEMTFERKRILFDRVDASAAGGKVRASGELVLQGPGVPAKVRANGEIDRVNLRFPSWLPSTLSGTLSLNGPLSRPLLKGDLLVHEARYQDNWDWQSKVLTFRRGARTERVHRLEEERIGLDLSFRTEGSNFLLRNNLATATMRGEVRVVGSDLGMGLLGRVEVLEGKVLFLDNTFELSPGLILFDREDSIHASFDLNAKTKVSTTDIFLEIRTEKENVVAFLSSQPVKDETNLISLLTLGVDVDELMAAGNKNQDLSSAVLPTVLSGAVQPGIESGLKKARLVDTFQFAPYFSEDTKTTGLKVIVGKELFPKVRLLVSTDVLNPGADNAVKLEQRFSDHVSLQGSYTERQQRDTKDENSLGLDFEFRFEF